MATIEVVIPAFKKELGIIERSQPLLPVLFKALNESGVDHGIRVWITSKDGKDVSEDVQEAYVWEWQKPEDFHDFINNAVFKEFQVGLKPLVTGPPDLSLYDANIGATSLGDNKVLSLVVIRPKDQAEEAVKAIFDKVAAGVAKTRGSKTIFGTSSNLDHKQIAVIEGFKTQEAYDAVKDQKERQKWVDDLRGSADVTELVGSILNKLSREGTWA